MTSEASSNDGRRPPTIELKATEVPEPAAAADAGASPGDAAPAQNSGPAESAPPPSGGAGRLLLHALSAIVGAVAAVAIIAALWFGGIVSLHRPTAPVSATASQTRAPDGGQDLSARLDKIEHALQARPDRQALTERVAAAEAQTKAIRDLLATLNRRLDDVAGMSESATKQAAAAQSTAQAAKTASDNASQASQHNVGKGDLDALADRVAALENTVKGLADAASRPVTSGNDRAARLTVAAEALRAAIARGTPYQAELAALQALGVPPNLTAPLEPFAASGVPTAAALAHELAGLVPALQRAVAPAPETTTFLGRLAANARHLVRITPAQAPAGNAPSAVIARIEADASRTDIGAAKADVAALPDSAKPVVAGWLEKADARQAALDASRQIAVAALAALSKPVSQ